MALKTLCILVFLYFLQGLPYGIQIKFLPILLRTHGISLTSISLFKLLFLPWALKVVWAPLVSQYGTKKKWMMSMLILTSLACMSTSMVDFHRIPALAFMLFIQNLFVSIMDISVDAIAVEILSTDSVGFGNVGQVVGYKVGGVLGGALYMFLHDELGHGLVYTLLSLFYFASCLIVMRLDLHDSTNNMADDVAVGDYAFPGQKKLSYTDLLKKTFNYEGTIWMIFYTVMYKCGENGSISMLPLYLIDGGANDRTVAFYTGVWGSFTTIAGSMLGGFVLKKYSVFNSSCLVNNARSVIVCIITGLVLLNPNPLQANHSNAVIGIQLVLCSMQLFLSGISSILTFSWMMHLSQSTPQHLQPTHYTILATSEILGKLVFVSLIGYVTDIGGYSVTFTLLALLSILNAITTYRAPKTVLCLDKKY